MLLGKHQAIGPAASTFAGRQSSPTMRLPLPTPTPPPRQDPRGLSGQEPLCPTHCQECRAEVIAKQGQRSIGQTWRTMNHAERMKFAVAGITCQKCQQTQQKLARAASIVAAAEMLVAAMAMLWIPMALPVGRR